MTVRLSEMEKENITAEARKLGMSVSTYVRYLVLKDATKWNEKEKRDAS